jgi:hypothetical protein
VPLVPIVAITKIKVVIIHLALRLTVGIVVCFVMRAVHAYVIVMIQVAWWMQPIHPKRAIVKGRFGKRVCVGVTKVCGCAAAGWPSNAIHPCTYHAKSTAAPWESPCLD